METAQLSLAPRPAVDVVMRRLLRIPDRPPVDATAAARSAFSRSILVSATRCLLTYVVLPFLGPVFHATAGVGPVLGLAIGSAALASNVASMRRFWAADHRWRWAYTAVAVGVMVLVELSVVGVVEVGSRASSSSPSPQAATSVVRARTVAARRRTGSPYGRSDSAFATTDARVRTIPGTGGPQEWSTNGN